MEDNNQVFDLKNFDSYREDNRLEVKNANGGLPGSLWETYSSFANTYGGCIICGVVEKKDGSWKTTGLKNLSKLKKDFWDTIHNSKKVSKCLISENDTEEYTYHGDVILVIKVPRASRSEKPIYINNDVYGGTYRRDHEGDYSCTEDEVKAMIRDSSEKSPDQEALDLTARGKKLTAEEVFDPESIKAYRIRYNTRHEGSAWSELDDIDFLVQISAANDESEYIRPTVAGLLMFGTERRTSQVYSDYFLDYQEHMDANIRWTDRIYSQEPEWSGNVFDFYQPWNVIIGKYPDKIVMANPGTIICGKKQMLKGGISQPRNKGLFKMFNLIGFGEHAGSGVPDIFKAWKDEGLAKPEVDEEFGGRGDGHPDRTILTLPLFSGKHGSGTNLGVNLTTSGEASGEADLIQKVLDYCVEPRKKKEIQEFLGIKSERYVRERVINPLIENGKLVRTIPDKPKSPKQKYVKA